jgi:hypothetical protein
LITAVDLPKMQAIERHLGRRLPRVPVPTSGQAPVAPAPGPQVEAQTAAPSDSVRRPRRRRRAPSVGGNPGSLAPAPLGS